MPHLPSLQAGRSGSEEREQQAPGREAGLAPVPRDWWVLGRGWVWLPRGNTVKRHRSPKKTRIEE